LRLAVGDQRFYVLIGKAGIALTETDRNSARCGGEVDELLHVFAARRRRRVLSEFENEIEDRPDVLGEIHDVFVERAVIDGEETQLAVL
jgi:hypothetical protein